MPTENHPRGGGFQVSREGWFANNRRFLRGYPGGAICVVFDARDRPCATAQKMSRFTRLVGSPRRIFMNHLNEPGFLRSVAEALLDGSWTREALLQRTMTAME